MCSLSGFFLKKIDLKNVQMDSIIFRFGCQRFGVLPLDLNRPVHHLGDLGMLAENVVVECVDE